jgi:hypothetical protein
MKGDHTFGGAYITKGGIIVHQPAVSVVLRATTFLVVYMVVYILDVEPVENRTER